jgi:gamma-glutamylputrescine oxidase
MPRDPLTRNDPVPGAYPGSWYAASAPLADPRAPLKGAHRADVAIVGAGYTGLWAAKTLAEAGLRPVVLEAHRVGWGASGPHGGQVGTGYNWHPEEARRTARTRRRPRRLGPRRGGQAPASRLRRGRGARGPLPPGLAHGEYSASDARESRENAEHLARYYGYDQIEALDRDAFRALVTVAALCGRTLDRGRRPYPSPPLRAGTGPRRPKGRAP